MIFHTGSLTHLARSASSFNSASEKVPEKAEDAGPRAADAADSAHELKNEATLSADV